MSETEYPDEWPISACEAVDKAQERIAELEAAVEKKDIENSQLVMKVRAADVMAKVADDWVERGRIDSRSALADARLDYGDPYKYSDDALVARAEKAEAELSDIRESCKLVMDERCHNSGKHCACVPILRDMVKKAESQLALVRELALPVRTARSTGSDKDVHMATAALLAALEATQ